MEITNYQIFTLFEGLQEISKNKGSIPVSTGYYLIRNINILKPYYSSICEMLDNIANEESLSQEEKNKKLQELSDCENQIDLCRIPISKLDALSLPLSIIEKVFLILEE